MSHYAIGDVQGCYSELMVLLDKINFNEHEDTLWFAGDLINRGPDNLSVLRFISRLPKTIVVLGNHDLHFLGVFHGVRPRQAADTFEDILNAPDCEELSFWLQSIPLVHYDSFLNYLIVHAGVSPFWSLNDTLYYSKEVEQQLNSENVTFFLEAIFGKHHDEQSQHWRLIIDTFTRMRFCNKDGRLNLSYKGTVSQAPAELSPWFSCSNPKNIWQSINVLFGHWAALEPNALHSPRLFALDTGCVWGGKLSALRLEDKQWFQVKGKNLYENN